MNTENSQQEQHVDAMVLTIGERLRQGREQLGLTQQVVAQRLCLKVSTIRDLEDDRTFPDLAATFLRGYIRSYAKLVRIPEEELLTVLVQQTPPKETKMLPIQHLSLGKKRTKREGWLMTVTWLVFLVVIGITGFWWWQNHQAQQQDIVNMAEGSSPQLTPKRESSSGSSAPLTLKRESSTGSSSQLALQAGSSGEIGNMSTAEVVSSNFNNEEMSREEREKNRVTSATTLQEKVPLLAGTFVATTGGVDSHAEMANQNETLSVVPGNKAATSVAPANFAGSREGVSSYDDLAMTFSDECWLEVKDATGKMLFSGIKKAGDKLSLVGVVPYQLRVGAPAAVKVLYQGKQIDLSEFIKSNRVASLVVGAE